MRAVGIMGGTFDPIHTGHLVVAEEVKYQFNLDKIIFVPSGSPPHKKSYPATDSNHRFQMTLLATSSNKNFEVSRIEIERKDFSYTINTITEFKRIYPDYKLYFITGVDAILEILTWHRASDMINLCEFIAVSRPGYPLDEIMKKLKKEFIQVIHKIEVPALAISSSDIRCRVKEGRPIKYLVPEVIEKYIYQNRLYV